jgi:hypothetical protein
MLRRTESIPMKSEFGAIHIRTLLRLYKIDENTNQHCSIRWLVNKVVDYKMDCDFKAMYGDAFSVLNTTAYCRFYSRRFSGRIEWKRNRLNFDHERS